jgi:hypothetical protein
MSKTFESVLSGLRQFGAARLGELDALCEEHKSWLASAVADVRAKAINIGPVAKKQKVASGAAKPTLIVAKKVRRWRPTNLTSTTQPFVKLFTWKSQLPLQNADADARPGRRKRSMPPPVLETVAEEGEEEEEAQPVCAPVETKPQDADPQPRARPTRANRGRKQQKAHEGKQATQCICAKCQNECPAWMVERRQHVFVHPCFRAEPRTIEEAKPLQQIEQAHAALPARRTRAAVAAKKGAKARSTPDSQAETAPVQPPTRRTTRRGARKVLEQDLTNTEPDTQARCAKTNVERGPSPAPEPKRRNGLRTRKAAAKDEQTDALAPETMQSSPKRPKRNRRPKTKAAAPAATSEERAADAPAVEEKSKMAEETIENPELPAMVEDSDANGDAEAAEDMEAALQHAPEQASAFQKPTAVSPPVVIGGDVGVVDAQDNETVVALRQITSDMDKAEEKGLPLQTADNRVSNVAPPVDTDANGREYEECEEVQPDSTDEAQVVTVEEEEMDTVKVNERVEHDVEMESRESPAPPATDNVRGVGDRDASPCDDMEAVPMSLSPKRTAEPGEKEEQGKEQHPPSAEAAPETATTISPAPEVEHDEKQVEAPAPATKSMAANLVSTIRSFLPLAKPTSPAGGPSAPNMAGKKAPKVKALEAAEAARRKDEERAAERIRQRQELERARQERLRAKAESEAQDARKREELRLKKEAEAAQRRKEREEAERREREDKARRLEEAKQRRREEAALAAAAAAAAVGRDNRHAAAQQSRPQSALATSADQSLEAAKQRLAKIQQQAALMHQQGASGSSKPGPSGQQHGGQGPSAGAPPAPPPSALPAPSSLASALPRPTTATPATSAVHPGEAQPQSYEISPYKSDFESDDEEPKKPVPDWARGKALVTQLMSQMYVDPDEVFQQHAKTCSLDDVFAGAERKNGKQDFSRRSSSGNWFEDRVTWKEELAYKKAMGYV